MGSYLDKTGLIDVLGKLKAWCNSRFVTSVKLNGTSHTPVSGEVDLGTITGGGSSVTESTVAGWGFTKNTGTYSKPSEGIPKTDLASAVQTSLGKADSAIQSSDLSWTSIAPADFFELGSNVAFSSSAGRVYINPSIRMVRFIVSVTLTPTAQITTRAEIKIFGSIKSEYSSYKPAWFLPCTALRDNSSSPYPIAAQLGTTGAVNIRLSAAASAGTSIPIKIGGIYTY